MAIGTKLKKLMSDRMSKTSNLYQNEDLVEELGYAKPSETPAPSASPSPDTGFMSSLSKALALRKRGKATIKKP
jgi:hypothetical protein